MISGNTAGLKEYILNNLDELFKIRIEKGKIIEQGNHASLMAKNGTYRKLVEMQSFQ